MVNYDHTLNMFNHSWHPLTGEISEYFKYTEFTKQAFLVIEKSRNIWGSIANNEKFKIAQTIWKYILSVSKRNETSFFVVNPPLADMEKILQRYNEITLEIKKLYGSDIVKVSDSEIKALFAINRACKVLKDYKGIEVSGLDINRNRMFLESDIDIAEAILRWALQAQLEMRKPTVGNSNSIERNVFRMSGNNWEIKFLSKPPIHMDDLVGWRYMRYVIRHIKERISVMSLQQIAGNNTRSELDRQRLRNMDKKYKLNEYDDECASRVKKKCINKAQNYLGNIFEIIEDLEIRELLAEETTTEDEEEITNIINTEEVTTKIDKIKEIVKTATGSTGKALCHHIDVIIKIIKLRNKKMSMEEDENQEETNRIQDKIEDLKRQFSDSLMKGSSKIKSKSDIKMAYDAVSKAIKKAKKEIQKKHPELFNHLEDFINYKDGKYVYEPIEDPQWLFD